MIGYQGVRIIGLSSLRGSMTTAAIHTKYLLTQNLPCHANWTRSFINNVFMMISRFFVDFALKTKDGM